MIYKSIALCLACCLLCGQFGRAQDIEALVAANAAAREAAKNPSKPFFVAVDSALPPNCVGWRVVKGEVQYDRAVNVSGQSWLQFSVPSFPGRTFILEDKSRSARFAPGQAFLLNEKTFFTIAALADHGIVICK